MPKSNQRHNAKSPATNSTAPRIFAPMLGRRPIRSAAQIKQTPPAMLTTSHRFGSRSKVIVTIVCYAKGSRIQAWHLFPFSLQSCSMNDSTETPACFKMPDKVPTRISAWLGTTQPDAPRRITTWLPFWRTTSKPIRCRAAMHSRPVILGSLGMSDFKRGHQRRSRCLHRKLFQKKLSCLFEVMERFSHGITLCRGACFGIVRHIPPIGIRRQNGC